MATGHDVVAKFLADVSGYVSEMKRMQEETKRTRMITQALVALVKIPLAAAAGAVKAAWSAIVTPIRVASDILKTALGVMTGNLLSGGIQGIIGKMREWLTIGFQFNNRLEEARMSFGVMFRDVTAGTDLVKDLYKYAAYTVYEFENVEKAATSLAGAGVKSGQMMATLKMLGELGNTNTRPIEEIAELYAKIFSAHKITGEELRQFRRLGIPVFEELGKVLGISVEEINKWAEEGKIGVGEFQRALVGLTQPGSQFYQMQQKLAQTTPGIWATLKDSARMALGEIAASLVEIFDLKSLMREGVNFATWLQQMIKEWTPIVKAWWDDFKVWGINAILELTAKGIDFAATFASAIGQSWSLINEILSSIMSAIRETKSFIEWVASKTPMARNKEFADLGAQMAATMGVPPETAAEMEKYGAYPGAKRGAATNPAEAIAETLRALAVSTRRNIGTGRLFPPLPSPMLGPEWESALRLEGLRTPPADKDKKGGGASDLFAKAVGGTSAWDAIHAALKTQIGDPQLKAAEKTAKETEESRKQLEKLRAAADASLAIAVQQNDLLYGGISGATP